jgi:hypothetical protein
MTSSEVLQLLARLCTQYGFCLPVAARRRIADQLPHDPTAFTEAVFVAEGLDPLTADRHLYRQIRTVVADTFRASKIAAEQD